MHEGRVTSAGRRKQRRSQPSGGDQIQGHHQGPGRRAHPDEREDERDPERGGRAQGRQGTAGLSSSTAA